MWDVFPIHASVRSGGTAPPCVFLHVHEMGVMRAAPQGARHITLQREVMKTLVKTLLFVCWLLGAGMGISLQSTEPARDMATYYTVTEGIDLSVHGHRVTLHLRSRAIPGSALSLSTAAPRWMAALSDRLHPALRTASVSSMSGSEAPSARVAHLYYPATDYSATDQYLP